MLNLYKYHGYYLEKMFVEECPGNHIGLKLIGTENL